MDIAKRSTSISGRNHPQSSDFTSLFVRTRDCNQSPLVSISWTPQIVDLPSSKHPENLSCLIRRCHIRKGYKCHIKSMDTWLTQGQDPWPVFSVPTRMCAVCLDQLRIMGWTKVVLTPNNLSHQFKSSKGHLHVLDRNKGRKLSLESNNFKPSIWMISAKSQGTQHKIEKKVVRILLTARKAKTVP